MVPDLLIVLSVAAQPPAVDADWKKRFTEADVPARYQLIDDALRADEPPVRLLFDLVNTDSRILEFPTVDVFRVFRKRTVLKLGGTPKPEFNEILQRFYSPGSQERTFRHQGSYEIPYDPQRIVASTVSPDGTTFVLETFWWLGCQDDLWLFTAQKGNQRFDGPYFTGIVRDEVRFPEAPTLVVENGKPFLVQASTASQPALRRGIAVDDLKRDSDRDGFYDLEETRLGTNPKLADTDRDGIVDGRDLNPLTAQTSQRARDLALQAVFRLDAIANYPINLYVVETDDAADIEYFTSSSNAIIIPKRPDSALGNSCGAGAAHVLTRRFA